MESKYGIPDQLEGLDFVPVHPDKKGTWSLGKNEMTDAQVKAAMDTEAWSERGLKKDKYYLSWPKFNLLPSNIREDIYTKYDEFSIKTGKQQGCSKYLVVIDLDNDNGQATDNLNAILKVLPETFIRRTQSGGYHIFYYIPAGTINFTDRKRVDLRSVGLDIEVLNGVLTKEIGPNRDNYNDNRIAMVGMPDFKDTLNGILMKLAHKDESTDVFKPKEQLGDYSEVANPIPISWEEMEQILNDYYLPVYIQPELKGLRDTRILFATMGTLKKYYSKEICQKTLQWIEDVAEYQKIDSTADPQNYDFGTEDKVGIPTLIDPTDGKFDISFQEFVDRITPLAGHKVGVSADLGHSFLEETEMEVSLRLEEIFEELMPGNGKLMSLMWASAVATAKGNPNIVTILGNPGEGKTVMMEYVLKFIPDNYIIRLNDVTIPALLTDTHDLGPDYLDKKIVYLGDLGAVNALEDSADARKVLRILLTDGHWARKKHTKIDIPGSRIAKDSVIHEELTGKPAMWFTTVREDGDDQDRDRSIIATPNLKEEKRIKYLIQHLNKDSRTGRKIKQILEDNIPVIQSLFQALVETDAEVIIPWDISEMEFKFRDSARIVNITSLLGLINMQHRNRYGPYILPGDNDLLIVLDMLDKSSNDLSELVVKRLKQIYDKYGEEAEFTRQQCMRLPGFTDAYGRSDKMAPHLLDPAIEAMILTETTPDDAGRTTPKTYQFLQEPKTSFSKTDLPEYDMEMLEWEYGEHEITEVSQSYPNFPNTPGKVGKASQKQTSIQDA